MRKIVIIIVLHAIITNVHGQTLKDVDKSVMIEIKKKIKNIPKGLEKNYGFTNRLQLDSIQIFPAIQIYKLNIKDSNIYKVPNVIYPIHLNEKIIFFAKGMKMEDGSLKILGIGGNIFAQKMDSATCRCDFKTNISLLQITEPITLLYFDEREKDRKQELKFYGVNQIDDCSQCFIKKNQSINLLALIMKLNQYHIKNSRDENYTN